ncbi:efflux RND transporter periplasmic adaptor subunit [Sulfuricurvum sp.]|uniref:efflux RND transporter periplasmic adaptor subunit n=1 Tax=Sulfuricurvum sp. TaxID=2025608 RepID=UPI00261FC0F5|nr:efflux RND transporter periplasmic adaptor subunit [Sulfuricurvum sp.]MDD2781512.1 efflux RND transporter periplasmic adaptor subunit [Sulfuricurvum sp.]
MSKILFSSFLIFSATFLGAVQIPTDTVQSRPFGATINVNAKVIQQKNDQHALTSSLEGYIEEYYVRAGDTVKKGSQIARLRSVALSKLAIDYQSLKTQYTHFDKNFQSDKALYERGMISRQEMTTKQIERDALLSQIKGIEVQLKGSNVNPTSLKNNGNSHYVYASASGRIGEILEPVGAFIKDEKVMATIINADAFYLQCYIPLKYSAQVQKGQKVLIKNNAPSAIYGQINRVLPSVDEATQRITALASLDKSTSLYLNQYVGATIYTQKDKNYLAVKKSALTFFQNEWVVFVPTVAKAHKEEKKEEHGKHEEHDDHEEEKAPYEARVVEIIAKDDQYVAVKGLKAGERYVSDKSYYVKSMLLKAAIGEHGH